MHSYSKDSTEKKKLYAISKLRVVCHTILMVCENVFKKSVPSLSITPLSFTIQYLLVSTRLLRLNIRLYTISDSLYACIFLLYVYYVESIHSSGIK